MKLWISIQSIKRTKKLNIKELSSKASLDHLSHKLLNKFIHYWSIFVLISHWRSNISNWCFSFHENFLACHIRHNLSIFHHTTLNPIFSPAFIQIDAVLSEEWRYRASLFDLLWSHVLKDTLVSALYFILHLSILAIEVQVLRHFIFSRTTIDSSTKTERSAFQHHWPFILWNSGNQLIIVWFSIRINASEPECFRFNCAHHVFVHCSEVCIRFHCVNSQFRVDNHMMKSVVMREANHTRYSVLLAKLNPVISSLLRPITSGRQDGHNLVLFRQLFEHSKLMRLRIQNSYFLPFCLMILFHYSVVITKSNLKKILQIKSFLFFFFRFLYFTDDLTSMFKCFFLIIIFLQKNKSAFWLSNYFLSTFLLFIISI